MTREISKKVYNAIFCIEPVELDKLYFDDIFSGKYDNVFLLHTGFSTQEILDSLSVKDKKAIDEFINMHNFIIYED
jgi:hypothetical protein